MRCLCAALALLAACARTTSWIADTRTDLDGAAERAAPDHPGDSRDAALALLERSLTCQQTDGTSWLHLFSRAPGAVSPAVRVVTWSDQLVPQIYDLTAPSLPVGCKELTVQGERATVPFSTVVKYCLTAGSVEVSSTSTLGGQPQAPVPHGTVSLDPAAPGYPLERSLSFSGTAGSTYLHLAQRAGSGVVGVRTISYSSRLSPSFFQHEVPDLRPGECQLTYSSGTVTASGQAFTTELRHCRVAGGVELSHSSVLDGVANAGQVHGVIPLP